MMSVYKQPKDTELDDFEKELNSYIENEEKNKKEKQNQNTMEKEKGKTPDSPQKTTVRELSDNEDSEVDDYNLTEDQKRALEELDNLKTELGYPDEDPPEYDVTERLKILNEELKNDPTPVEKQNESKVGFKQNLVDLVAPPPDFSEDETDEKKAQSPTSTKTNKPAQKQNEDKVDEKSENVSGSSKKSNSGKKDEVLIEIDGQFKLVSADDVRAKDLGYSMDHDKNKENEKKQSDKSEKNKAKIQPAPPGKPRPATAVNSRRNIRTTSAKQRPQSAGGSVNHGSALNNFNYNSPYALSPREKELMEERKKALEKQRQDDERRKKNEEESKERENQEAFEYWLKKKRENDRRRRIQEEEERKKNNKEDRKRIQEFEQNKEFATYDILYYKTASDSEETGSDFDEKEENEEAFKGWLKEKNSQFKKEKLLKRRQDQEMHEGYYVRSREECEKAYKQWLKHKAIEARKARQAERTKAKLQRLAARRARKGITLSKSIRESQSFRYVDYYGYRF